jgi:hypothetical protein
MKKFCLMTLVLSLGLWVSNAASGVDCPVLVYQTDFSNNQGWHTDNPHNHYLDSLAPGGSSAYYVKQVNILHNVGEYAYYDVGHTGGSFCLSWDMMVKDTLQYAAGLSFGLYSENLGADNSPDNYAEITFGSEDRGNLIFLNWSDTTKNGRDDSLPYTFLTDTWYQLVMEYDVDAHILKADVTLRGGGLVASLSCSGVGPFDKDMMGYLGNSNLIEYCSRPGNWGEGYFDNVVLSVPEPATLLLIGLGGLGLLRRRKT